MPVAHVVIQTAIRPGYEQYVLPPVIVVVEKSAAAAEGFQTAHGTRLHGPGILQPGGGRCVFKRNAMPGSGRGWRRTEGGRSGKRMSASTAKQKQTAKQKARVESRQTQMPAAERIRQREERGKPQAVNA